ARNSAKRYPDENVTAPSAPAPKPARTRLLIGSLLACAVAWGLRLEDPQLLARWNPERILARWRQPAGTVPVEFGTLNEFSYHFVGQVAVPKDFRGVPPGFKDTIPAGVRALSGKPVS